MINYQEIYLVSENLILRPIEVLDEEYIFNHIESGVPNYFFPKGVKKAQDIGNRIDDAIEEMEEQNEVCLAIFEKDENGEINTANMIGTVSIFNLNSEEKNSNPEIGIWITKRGQGKNYGEEAIREFKKWVDSNISYKTITYICPELNYANRRIIESINAKAVKKFSKTDRNQMLTHYVEYKIGHNN